MNRNNHFDKTAIGCVIFMLVLLLFLSCAQKKDVKKDPFFEKWRITAENSKGYSPSPKRSTGNMIEKKDETRIQKDIEIPVKESRIETENLLPANKISLKMHDIDLVVLLRAMAKAANQNIMINEKVKGKANITISEAPWDQVFKGILRTHGLTYSWEGNIIRIMTVEDMAQDLKREAQKREFRMVAPLRTQIIKINYTEAAKLKANLDKFLTVNDEGKPMGSVMVDEHTNSLIIQAIKEDVERMISLIEELDRPTPLVLIEAHIVEATKGTARELGVQWGGISHHGFWVTPGLSDADLGTKLSAGGIDPTPGWASNFPAEGVTSSLGMTIGFAVEDIGQSILAAQLSALQQDGKLNILSSPSITTLDNQKAIIESGTEVPYQTVENGEVKIEYKKAVLSLEVTPSVIDGKTLKMNIFTKKDELDFTNAVNGQPSILTKKAETKVLLFDGQTTVIGGLSKEKNERSESGVPTLKDIPLLGWLFKSTDNSDQMDDLLIFITPHILKEKKYDAVQNIPEEKIPPADSPPMPEATPQ